MLTRVAQVVQAPVRILEDFHWLILAACKEAQQAALAEGFSFCNLKYFLIRPNLFGSLSRPCVSNYEFNRCPYRRLLEGARFVRTDFTIDRRQFGIY
jgi:hypothetical protein